MIALPLPGEFCACTWLRDESGVRGSWPRGEGERKSFRPDLSSIKISNNILKLKNYIFLEINVDSLGKLLIIWHDSKIARTFFCQNAYRLCQPVSIIISV